MASVAGHLIECGAQATGGLCQDWENVPNLANVGYPIAEVFENGESVISKPLGSGGEVSSRTIATQLVYEIDDPAAYITPDVIVDMTNVQAQIVGADRVRVSAAKGKPAPSQLKASAIYRDGWSASGLLAVVGRNAAGRARAAGQIVLDRVKRAGFELAQTKIECLGAGEVVPGIFQSNDPNQLFEVVLRVSARDPRKQAIDRFCREFAPLVTSGPAGIAGYAGGRPKPTPAFGYWPTLAPRECVDPQVVVRTASEWIKHGALP